MLLLSIFPPNMPGRRLRLTGICTLTVCGYPGSLKDMATPPFCWTNVSGTVKKKVKRTCYLIFKEKMGYLSDPEYLKYKGFETADAADPYFELMYLAFDKNADKPCFRHTVKNREGLPRGLVLYYTGQCPFTAKYVPLLETAAKERDVELQTVHIRTKRRRAKCPVSLYNIFTVSRW